MEPRSTKSTLRGVRGPPCERGPTRFRLGYQRADFSPQRYTSRSKRLSHRLRLIIECHWIDPTARRLVKRLVRHEEPLFTFVNTEGVPFDNNPAEREIRSAVVMRKDSYGNRSEQGARTQAILMTVFRTLSKKQSKTQSILSCTLSNSTSQLVSYHP
jgi:hypothetical protein